MNIEILCEGFHDRAFWKGLLLHSGWRENHRVVKGGGRFGYSLDDHELIVTPYKGKSNLQKATLNLIESAKTNPIDRIIVNTDCDHLDFSTQSCKDQLRTILNRTDQEAEEKESGFIVNFGKDQTTQIQWVVWGTKKSGGNHLPKEQTLERLVCAALLKAYPDRKDPVTQFLQSEPLGEEPGPKHYAWSHMAKWHGERGCDDFYAALWEDKAVADELECLMRETGAWAVVDQLPGTT